MKLRAWAYRLLMRWALAEFRRADRECAQLVCPCCGAEHRAG